MTKPRNSLAYANNARKNKRSPWRTAPHVDTPANRERREKMRRGSE